MLALGVALVYAMPCCAARGGNAALCADSVVRVGGGHALSAQAFTPFCISSSEERAVELSIPSTTTQAPVSALERAHQYLACAVLAPLCWLVLLKWRWPARTGASSPCPTVAGDARGPTTLALEKALERYMPQRDALIAYCQRAALATDWRRQRAGAWAVRDWIFLTEELQYASEGGAFAATHRVAARYRPGPCRQGVTLVVALVPDKARLHADHVVGAIRLRPGAL